MHSDNEGCAVFALLFFAALGFFAGCETGEKRERCGHAWAQHAKTPADTITIVRSGCDITEGRADGE